MFFANNESIGGLVNNYWISTGDIEPSNPLNWRVKVFRCYYGRRCGSMIFQYGIDEEKSLKFNQYSTGEIKAVPLHPSTKLP